MERVDTELTLLALSAQPRGRDFFLSRANLALGRGAVSRGGNTVGHPKLVSSPQLSFPTGDLDPSGHLAKANLNLWQLQL